MSPFELLLFGLLVAGVVLFNYLTQQAAKRARQREALRTATPDVSAEHAWGRASGESARPAPDAMEQYEWGRQRDPVESGSARPLERHRDAPAPSLEELHSLALARSRTEAEEPSPPTSQRQVQATRLFRNRDDLRRAVIAMTVLGPCRAMEPADLSDRDGPMPRSR